MIRQGKKFVVSLAALAAVALGAGALAQAGQTTPKPAKAVKAAAAQKAPEPAESTSGPDRDKVQSGDQTTPDKPGSREQPDAAASSGETPESAGESPESSGETGSEVPGNDGPGGHADEPGNPNADHQFSGQE